MEQFNLHSYDKYLVQFSGGKDSSASFLHLLDEGVPKEKIELWHQEIDARDKTFFDWEITPDYCRKFAKTFGVKIFFQWKEGGFKREMLRKEEYTAPTHFECTDYSIGKVGGKSGKLSTRWKFPQASPDLKVRWCSSYLKIDVCTSAIVNQERFRGIRTLVISGERGEESARRAKYPVFEPDRADLRNGKQFQRHVDRYRPMRDTKEREVWEIIERYRIRVHPCYYMGWGRCSCKFCVFSRKNQFASAAVVSPVQTQLIIRYEKRFGCTIKRETDLQTLIHSGSPYKDITPELKALATSRIYTPSIILADHEKWVLPAGAYGENCGAM